MNDETLHASLDHVLAFQTLGAGEVDLRVRTIEVGDDVVLEGELDLASWERVYRAGAFHLDGEQAPAELVGDRPVRIALRLREALARRWEDAQALLEELLTDAASPLRHSEAWLATAILQSQTVPDVPDAVLEVGVRTSWARPFVAD